MSEIQALNRPKSSHQHPYRITIWAGSPSTPGVRAEWVLYAGSAPAALGLAARRLRNGPGKKRHLQDWTVNLEPVREGETILPADPER